MNYKIGLDVGVASVGWAALDKSNKILDAGSRIFHETDINSNESRRNNRSMRRSNRRKKYRIFRVKKLLIESCFILEEVDIDFISSDITPYHLRVKGLRDKLSKKDIAVSLIHLSKRRGIHNVEYEEQTEDVINEIENNDDNESTKKILGYNLKLLKEKYVCELQLDRYEKEDSVRGIKNRFSTSDYEKEARKLLETQSKYYKEIDKDFIEKYIEILVRRREFFDGPGQQSKYSWKNQEEWMQKIMGKCKYFPNETRIVKLSYTAEMFNLLNDLNNLRINGEHISFEDKIEIIEKFRTKKTSGINDIAKYFGVDEGMIKGYRINKNKKPVITQLLGFHEIKKAVGNSIDVCNQDLMDSIAYILTVYQSEFERKKQLMERLELQEEVSQKLSKLDKFKGTHSLSKKAISIIWDDLLETSKNHMQLFTEMNLKAYKYNFKGEREISIKNLNDRILNPIVKRSIIQAIYIVNKLIKRYGVPSEISIELAREKNSEEAKKFIIKNQKENEKLNLFIKETLKKYGKRSDSNLFEKLKLLYLQDYKSIYSGEEITLFDFMKNSLEYEVDHIIPRSISFDNSLNNKVLVKRKENQDKGQNTPYNYFKSGKASRSYEEFKVYVLDLFSCNKISKRKLDYLILEEDIKKWDVQRTFINRNLSDTRYASLALKDILKNYFEDNDYDTVINTINGNFTYFLRKSWGVKKNRSEDYNHHAIDAIIVSMSSDVIKNFRNKDLFFWGNERIFDAKTYESLPAVKVLEDEEYKKLIWNIEIPRKEIESFEYKYSHKVDFKANRQMCDENIHSTRKRGDKHVIIYKYKDIYSMKCEKIDQIFSKKNNFEKLLVYKHDKETFDKLLKVYNEYKSETIINKNGKEIRVNPFEAYREIYGPIRKKSKKGNGPIIKSLKYEKSNLGSHMDLTHKYISGKNKDNKVVSLNLRLYRVDIYEKGGFYKFVVINHNMLKTTKLGYEIDVEKYEVKKEIREISKEHNFKFSLYTNQRIKIDGQEFIFISTDENNNIFYLAPINRPREKDEKIRKSIYKSKPMRIEKINTDILGERYFGCKENFKIKL